VLELHSLGASNTKEPPREPAVEEDAHERPGRGEERVDHEPRRAREQVRTVPLRRPARSRVPRPAPVLSASERRGRRRQLVIVLLAGSPR
jgi:hypothetical protein